MRYKFFAAYFETSSKNHTITRLMPLSVSRLTGSGDHAIQRRTFEGPTAMTTAATPDTTKPNLLVQSVVRHLIVLAAGALAAHGLMTASQSQQVIDPLVALAMAIGAQGWSWLHTTRYADAVDTLLGHAQSYAAQANSLAEQMFALSAPASSVVQAIQLPGGKLVPVPALAAKPVSPLAQEVTDTTAPAGVAGQGAGSAAGGVVAASQDAPAPAPMTEPLAPVADPVSPALAQALQPGATS
jgi:hypothetical protein